MPITKVNENVPCNPSDDYVTQFGWQAVGSITTLDANLAGGTLTGANLADAVIQALADTGAKVCIYRPANGTVASEFRFSSVGGANNETVTLEVYAAAGTDVYRHVAQLTLTIGTAQHGAATKLFVDTIAEVDKVWLTTTSPISPADNSIASWALNMHGYDRIAFAVSATTGTMDGGASTDTLYVEARRF